jgi:hypothetical protein
MLLHILLFDRAYSVTYWVNYSELRFNARRRYATLEVPAVEQRQQLASQAALALRLRGTPAASVETRGALLQRTAPGLDVRTVFLAEQGPHVLSSSGNLSCLRGAFGSLSLFFEGGVLLLKGGLALCRAAGAVLSSAAAAPSLG